MKKKRNILFGIQTILVLAAMMTVGVICIREIRSLCQIYRPVPETTIASSEAASETNPAADTEVTEKESETETDSKLESKPESEENSPNEEEKKEIILSNTGLYPEKILAMLDKNEETLDFVYHYPEKAGSVSEDPLTDEDMAYGKIPLLIQWDERWGYQSYGENVIGTSGCGPTCLAMVIAGLTGNKEITPATIAIYSEEHGYLDSEGNTVWSLMTDGGKSFGVQGRSISLTKSSVIDALDDGNPIICSVRPGDFTDSGHFIVLTEIAEDGNIRVNDPYSYANSEKTWSYEQLEPQIKALWKLWAIDLGE
jgi:hypothetical protein